MELTKTQIENAIEILKNADGEDLQNILEKIGMDEQILKQLSLTRMYRLTMIMDDVKAIKQFINENNLDETFQKPTKHSDECYTHFNNIEIACDINSNECLNWGQFYK